MRRLAALVVLALLVLPGAARPAGSSFRLILLGAIHNEQSALVLLDKSPIPWDKVREHINNSLGYLVEVRVAVKSAAGGGAHPGDVSLVEGDLTNALDSDHAAVQFARQEKAHLVSGALHRGLAAKHKALLLASQLTTRCEARKEFQVFAIPEGFSGSFSDVFPHGIPKGAKGMAVRFVDSATGKAPVPEVFPGQTWESQVKGFTSDGKLDVRVNLSGTGFGKPDANAKTWTVVVTYDC